MGLETKTNLNQETVAVLQELIQMNVDSREGFHHSAEAVEDMTVSTLFQSLAHQRQEQMDELSRYVESSGIEPQRSGSFAGALHRNWMRVRELLSRDDLSAVLVEAERGEGQIKEAYENALRQTAGSAVNDVLTRHHAQVKAAHDRVRDLRDEHAV